MNFSSGWCACAAYAGSLSRSGPIFPVAPAAFNVWQDEQPLLMKIALPAPGPETDAPADLTHAANASGFITITVERMTEWPRPQSSVQTIGYVPILFGVTVRCVTIPGTASCFCPNSGTQKEWMTSSARIVKCTVWPSGRRRMSDDRPLESGYLKLQANCCAVMSTFSGCLPSRSSRASTIALMIAIEVTSTNGTAVQAISRPVCPWIGGPSDSSSGGARKCSTEYVSTAATIAKITAQITVTYQKTKSIRCACSDACGGSQLGTSATKPTMTKATTANSPSCRRAPLRTGGREPTASGSGSVTRSRVSPEGRRPFRQRATRRESERDPSGRSKTRRRSNGNRSQPATDRRRCDSHVGGDRDGLRPEHPHGRCDPADHRDHRPCAVDGFLVVLGRPRVLGQPASHVHRRRTAWVLDQPLNG